MEFQKRFLLCEGIFTEIVWLPRYFLLRHLAHVSIIIKAVAE